METKIINIDNLLFLKITAASKDFIYLYNRFPNIKICNHNYDYEIFYKSNSNFEKINFGRIMKPFRNSTYIVNDSDNEIIAYCPKQKYSCENLIKRKDNKISVFCDNDYNNKVLIRVVTELMLRSLLEKNCFPLHSSCVLLNGEAKLFLGQKNSGKSLALISKVLYNKALPISNDITFIGKENNSWKVFSLPYDITISKDILMQINNDINMEKINIEKKYESNKYRLDLLEFSKLFNVNWIFSAPVSNINVINLNKKQNFKKKLLSKKEDILYYLNEFGKDDNFNFDDFLMINSKYPKFNYKQLAEEIEFNKLEGNILKHYLR